MSSNLFYNADFCLDPGRFPATGKGGLYVRGGTRVQSVPPALPTGLVASHSKDVATPLPAVCSFNSDGVSYHRHIQAETRTAGQGSDPETDRPPHRRERSA